MNEDKKPLTRKEVLEYITRGLSMEGLEIEDFDLTGDRFNHLANFKGATFLGKAVFERVIFYLGADFQDVIFKGENGANFKEAEFQGETGADFSNAQFTKGKADFNRTRFKEGRVDFRGVNFSGAGGVSFSGTYFISNKGANFLNAKFSGEGGIDWRNATFSGQGETIFKGAIFSCKGDVDFSEAQFNIDGLLDFSGARFSGEGKVKFKSAKFSAKAGSSFMMARFTSKGAVDFSFAIFNINEDADFTGVQFLGDGGVDFSEAQFSGKGRVYFSHAQFSGIRKTDFTGARFSGTRGADFNRAVFAAEEGTGFYEVEFSGNGGVNFSEAQFLSEGGVDFNRSKFSVEKGVNFFGALFRGEADFSWSRFSGSEGVVFIEAQFLAERGADFLGTKFSGEGKNRFDRAQIGESSILNFTHVEMERPENVCFIDVSNMGNVVFLYTNVEEMTFKNVNFKSIKGLGFRVGIADEVLKYDPQKNKYSNPEPDDKGHFHHVEILYRKLKLNFENQRDYARAGDFHYGELEMNRKQRSPFFRYFSLVFLYKLVSGYGQKWHQALLTFTVLVLLFSFPNMGWIKAQENTSANPDCVLKRGDVCWQDSLLFTFKAMTLQRQFHFKPKPEKRFGSFVIALQYLAGPTVIALMVLAIRRKFRR